jgi:hypothetical protein
MVSLILNILIGIRHFPSRKKYIIYGDGASFSKFILKEEGFDSECRVLEQSVEVETSDECRRGGPLGQSISVVQFCRLDGRFDSS